jgi:hypothetical protein
MCTHISKCSNDTVETIPGIQGEWDEGEWFRILIHE